MEHCPEGGKIHMIIFFSLLFTCIITSDNIINRDRESKVMAIGIIINIISFSYTLLLLKIDLLDSCKKIKNQKDCKDGCKWYGEDGCKKVFKGGKLYLFVFLLCSLYLLINGILKIKEESNFKDQIISQSIGISIASIISGAIGILFVITDLLLCTFG